MAKRVRPSRKPNYDRVAELLRAVERHRLLFLYCATATRHNPLAATSRTGVTERVFHDDVIGWKTLMESLDSEGEFLWTHRWVLDRYAQEAIGMFGPGEGARPTAHDTKGRRIPVEGGTYPHWSLNEFSDADLEDSSDAVLEACRALAERASSKVVKELIRMASAAARPPHHSRWYTNVIVPWSYLDTLDVLIERIKHARIELTMPSGSAKAEDIQQVFAHDSTIRFEGAPKNARPPSVELGSPGEPCTVNGRMKEPLTDGQYAVVSALILAGEGGLTKDYIEKVRTSARDILKRLRESDNDWADVICMAKRTNGRYRVRL